jgi:hypothetical protein
MRLTFTSASNQDESKEIEYEYLVVATGLQRPWPVVPVANTKVQYMKDAARQIKMLEEVKGGILIVGGGKRIFFLVYGNTRIKTDANTKHMCSRHRNSS